ncbi:NADH-cytochrome b5 reductase [Physocladia obscura]|uniref:NADH-cytochrome b5 reductase n=1 Tax=Physocladia obscura TaxID=109957 RepID=A0AAD5XF01_9FUNG|nr:NADH-cytochrome b5 reductase [Physocladia obscura]
MSNLLSLLARLDKTDRDIEDRILFSRASENDNNSNNSGSSESDSDAIRVASDSNVNDNDDSESDDSSELDPNNPPPYMLYCDPCADFVSEDSFSAKQRKETNFHLRYCLRHTSTSSFDTAFAQPEKIIEANVLPDIYGVSDDSDSSKSSDKNKTKSKSPKSRSIKKEAKKTAEDEFLASFGDSDSDANVNSVVAESSGSEIGSSDSNSNQSDSSNSEAFGPSKNRRSAHVKKSRRKSLSKYQKQRLSKKACSISDNSEDESTRIKRPSSSAVKSKRTIILSDVESDECESVVQSPSKPRKADSQMLSLSKTTIIVGGGLAGLSAAIESAKCGAAVTILEKESRLGGNSAKASSGLSSVEVFLIIFLSNAFIGMNAVSTVLQRQYGINDSVSLFIQDTMKAGKQTNDPELVKILGEKSADAYNFIEQLGVKLNDVSQCGGHSVPRTHREKETDGKPKAVGWDIMKSLQDHITSCFSPKTTVPETLANEQYGTIKVITGMRATKILGEHGRRASGVRVDNLQNAQCFDLFANSIVLATGGYAADTMDEKSLINMYTPQYAKLATTNGLWATGDGIRLGVDFGALAADLDKVQIHPTGFVDPKDLNANVKILAPESLRAYGSLLIDMKTSSRFVNELTTRDAVSAAMFATVHENANLDPNSSLLHPPVCLLLMNNNIVENYGKAAIGFYQKRGLVSEFPGLYQAAQSFGLNYSILESEVCIGKNPDADRFGKETIPTYFSANETFYAALVTPVRHYTMGGLRINSSGHILNEFGNPIEGLYGCGEVSCGVDGFNRLAGNSLLGSVVFGRIAGFATCS